MKNILLFSILATVIALNILALVCLEDLELHPKHKFPPYPDLTPHKNIKIMPVAHQKV